MVRGVVSYSMVASYATGGLGLKVVQALKVRCRQSKAKSSGFCLPAEKKHSDPVRAIILPEGERES